MHSRPSAQSREYCSWHHIFIDQSEPDIYTLTGTDKCDSLCGGIP